MSSDMPGGSTYPEYSQMQEGHITIDAIDPQYLREPNRRTSVTYTGDEAPGTIVVDPYAKFLYYVQTAKTPSATPSPLAAKGAGSAGGPRSGARPNGRAGRRRPT